MPANMENSAVATRLEKMFSFQSQRKSMPKDVQTTARLHSFHMLAKFSKPGFNSTWTENFQMFKLHLQKAGESGTSGIANIHWIIEKAREFKKTIYFCFIELNLSKLNFLTVWITTYCGKFFKEWEYQTTLPASWEICMQVKKQLLEPDMEQQTGSKLGKECIKAKYCHPTYSTYRQSTSCEMPGWINDKLESSLLGEISITSDMQITPPLWQKVKRN